MDLALNVLLAHGVEELSSRTGKFIKVKSDHIQMSGCIGLRDILLNYYSGHIRKCFVVSSYDLFSALYE